MKPRLRACAVLAIGLMAACAREARAQRRCRVAEVQVSPPDARIAVGLMSPFLPTAYDASGNPCTSATFVWSSNNVRVATIDMNGIVAGVAPGVAIITARMGRGASARSGQATIQVVTTFAEGVGTLTLGGVPADAHVRVDRELRSGTSFKLPVGPHNIEVEAAGFRPYTALVTIARNQTNVLLVTMAAGGQRRPTGPGCAAYDRQPEGTGTPQALFVNPLRLWLVRGESRPLAFYTVRGDGAAASRVCIVFEVDPSGAQIAMVDSFGNVSAGLDTGRTTIRVVVRGAQVARRTVTVVVRAGSIAFERDQVSMSPGTLDTLRLVVPSEGRRPFAIAPGMFQFSSSDLSVVRVGPLLPVIEALQPGTARITVESLFYPPITLTVTVRPG